MSKDWTDNINPVRAMRNVRKDMTGDWYRDPWAWPEYDFLMSGHLDWLARRARASGVRYVANIDVPKENFGIRPAVVMEPLDRLLYQGLVDATSEDLIAELAPWTHGWRLSRRRKGQGIYASQDNEWSRYRNRLTIYATVFDHGLKSDIVSCFASIPMDRLCEEIEERVGNGSVGSRLTDMLSAFDRVPGRRGLPQRSKASAALANLYLLRLDNVIRDHSESASIPATIKLLDGTLTFRWMDDFWSFNTDDAPLRSFQLDLQRAARGIGLELNLGKTELYSGQDLIDAIKKIQHSAIDNAMKQYPPDAGALESLIDQLIDSPEKADRTSIRFAMTRMRRHGIERRLEDILTATPRMPHGADHLARMFQEFDVWKSHQDWFLEYVGGAWGQIGWSVAQVGTMFPTISRPSRAVTTKFREFLASRPHLPLFALSAQRLSSWAPRTTRELLHDMIDEVDHPQERRIMGLTAAAVGEEKAFIRQILGEFEENQLTLSLLEDREFEPVEPGPDFSSDED